MTVLNKLASALGRRDEVPNQELARSIEQSKDTDAIKELVDNLTNKNKAIQQDCIKVLYEIGETNPKLIMKYLDSFVGLLSSKNNRLQWGGMIALNYIASEDPKGIYMNLDQIMNASDKGSVITRDHAVNILIKLASGSTYSLSAFSLLHEQIQKCSINQFPMYAERMVPIINEQNKADFIKVLNSRLSEIEKESKQKRILKILNKL